MRAYHQSLVKNCWTAEDSLLYMKFPEFFNMHIGACKVSVLNSDIDLVYLTTCVDGQYRMDVTDGLFSLIPQTWEQPSLQARVSTCLHVICVLLAIIKTLVSSFNMKLHVWTHQYQSAYKAAYWDIHVYVWSTTLAATDSAYFLNDREMSLFGKYGWFILRYNAPSRRVWHREAICGVSG